ncbi:hypothetical protein D3C87_1830920 [compost metagenome]
MRDPSVMASTWSCVTYTLVMPLAWCRRLISARISTRSLASRLDSGSSNKNSCGWRARARPMATRWRCPPDSWLGRRSSRWVICSMAATSSMRFLRSGLGILRISSAKPMLSATLSVGYSA